MAQTALFTGSMARKKRVFEKYEPNSYRVISEDAEHGRTTEPTKLPPLIQMPDVNILGQGKESNGFPEHRFNRPNPRHVNFLRQDVKLLNEPVCDVYTTTTHPTQDNWWPHHSAENHVVQPQHTLDTVVRDDFQYRGSTVKGNTRHSSNPNKQPVQGSVPVNLLRKPDGQQRVWKEGISYEHQYNCRLEPQYPIRAKRHGSFVWGEFSPAQVDQMMNEYNKKQQTSHSPGNSQLSSASQSKRDNQSRSKSEANSDSGSNRQTSAVNHGIDNSVNQSQPPAVAL